MKHTPLCLPILFFVLIAKITNAQISTEYQSMAVEGAHWICYKAFNKPWGDEYYSLSIRGDTILNSQVYKKMYRDDFFIDDANQRLPKFPNIIRTKLVTLIRDDVKQQKVYVVFLSELYKSCNGDGEVLLHDFSLNMGDTLKYCEIVKFKKFDSFSYVIDSVSYKGVYTGQQNNLYSYPGRKIMYSKGSWGGVSRIIGFSPPIIEGIGFGDFGPFFENWNDSLFGYRIGGLLRYCQGSNADCDIISSSQEIFSQPLGLFPNPVEERLYIKIPNAQTNLYVLRIYAADGKLLKQFSSLVGDYIDTSTLIPGQYYLQGIDGAGKTYSGRFIKI